MFLLRTDFASFKVEIKEETIEPVNSGCVLRCWKLETGEFYLLIAVNSRLFNLEISEGFYSLIYISVWQRV